MDNLKRELSRANGIRKADIFCMLSEVCDDQDILMYSRETHLYSKKIRYPVGISCGANNLGYAFHSNRNLDSAIYYYKQALKIRKENQEGVDKITETLNNLASVYLEQGNRSRAKEYLSESLAIQTDSLTESYVNVINELGFLYYWQSYNIQSIGLYQRALTISRKIKMPQLIATSLTNIGNAYIELGYLKEAHQYYEEAISVGRQNNLLAAIATAMNGLCLVYSRVGDIKRAFRHNDSSMYYNKKVGALDWLIEREGRSLLLPWAENWL